MLVCKHLVPGGRMIVVSALKELLPWFVEYRLDAFDDSPVMDVDGSCWFHLYAER